VLFRSLEHKYHPCSHPPNLVSHNRKNMSPFILSCCMMHTLQMGLMAATHPTLTHLSVQDCAIDTLLHVLQFSPALQHLTLSSNLMNDPNASAIFPMLLCSASLQCLVFPHLTLRVARQGKEATLELEYGHDMSELCVGEAIAVAFALEYNRTITSLTVPEHFLFRSMIHSLCQSLCTNTTLTHLNLVGATCIANDDTMTTVLGLCIASNTTLTHLSITHANLTSGTIFELCRSVVSNSDVTGLRVMDLSGNEIAGYNRELAMEMVGEMVMQRGFELRL